MAETPKNTLKQWFVTGAKPLQAQYWAWLDSYWHKSEPISINAIDGLGEILESKADADQLQHYALLDASNIGVNQGAWRTALGINDITPPDVDLTNYYTKPEVDSLLENVTVDLSNYYTATQTESAITSKGYITAAALTGYATENWVTTQTTPATQAEVEASTGTEIQPLSNEPATENRKFLTLFNFFKLIKKLRYIHLLPNSNPAVANRLWSDGTYVYYDDSLAIPKKLAYVGEIYEHQVRGKVLTASSVNGTYKCDLNAYTRWILTLTGNTKLNFTNMIADDETITITMNITGNFILEFPSWLKISPYSDLYDGNKFNRITIEIGKGGSSPSGWYNIIKFDS